MTRKELAQKYRDAAKSIENGWDWWSCNAIESQGVDASDYAKLFMPNVREINEACPLPDGQKWTAENLWPDGSWGSYWAESTEEQEGCRIVALCFMAAMVEAGDA